MATEEDKYSAKEKRKSPMAPDLKRYSHCPIFGELRYYPNECRICEPTANECEAQQIAAKVLIAYERQPIHGDALHLPNGKCITKDVWQLKLEDTLFDLLGTENSLKALRSFNLESWLKSTIEKFGTPQQLDQFKQLVKELDEANAPISGPTEAISSSDLISSFPELNASDLAHQPFHEIDCVRSAIPVAYRGDGFDVEDFSHVHGNIDDICFDDKNQIDGFLSFGECAFAHLSAEEINSKHYADDSDNDDDAATRFV
uniref:Uncharacterized protein n=1 Tax=Aureoumbra lagunensis TaxID=44058 RepID=A0A7S3JTV9_9STRA|mmetsp:Transcript_20351/g.26377  ORF Transcript_20351/g.26377 Transcript_20351/m.26377 type:complete len:258 (+) Transcript_20351:162-935(+)|eukprot:CAMPEP_0197291254 /NCGR_PEP_ID=MMETSP0890-20130614/11782_1 /TAXON_ID=44058 ORGANISM="Aureoumbra lagunensis, Strain CCMP1510" /NCGR_SAMPLE_ID=MMETSP0890 /ASSEMBLY_ACC=CAM_ASM_000533 /LENGTH=257 /DNA_ID=CAMNT_0042763923 /DNA_START=154 /DNA_END=927 /DNA_ORIENTATION=+